MLNYAWKKLDATILKLLTMAFKSVTGYRQLTHGVEMVYGAQVQVLNLIQKIFYWSQLILSPDLLEVHQKN